MNNIRKPKLIKRIAALAVDLMLWFLVSLMSLNFLINPVVNSITNYDYKTYEYRKEMYDVGAYVYVEYKKTSDSYYYEIKGDCTNNEFDNLTYNDEGTLGTIMLNTSGLKINSSELAYYVEMIYVNIGDLDTFMANKVAKSTLFDDQGNALSSAKEEDLKTYFLDEYKKVLNSEAFKKYKDGKISSLQSELNTIDIIKAYSSYLLSLLVFYLLIPLINKKRQTLGKMIMSLEVRDVKTEKNATKLQMTIRFASLVVIEFFLSMLLSAFLYLPFLLSIIMMVVTLNQSAVHDFIAGTRVVELVEESYFKKDALDVEYKEVDASSEEEIVEEEKTIE